MNAQMLIVFAILLATITLFVTDWLRLDLVALLALLALILSEVLTPPEALAGFSDPLVMIIAGLFVVGAGLFRTGVAALLGEWLGRAAGQSQTRLLVVIMLVVALLSAFMSSTGTVAILLPVVVSLGRRAGISPSRLLIPLSFSSLVGGMLTLIGTPPNIVVSNELAGAGLPPFNFFSFTPLGLAALLLSVAFMALFGRRLLPDRSAAGRPAVEAPSPADLAASYGVAAETLHRLAVRAGSPLAGSTVAEAALRTRYRLTVVGLLAPATRRGAEEYGVVDPATRFEAGSVLLINGAAGDVQRLALEQDLELLPDRATSELAAIESIGVADVVLTPRSRLVGHTLAESRFRERHELTVLSVLRMGTPLGPDFAATPLRFGDALLVQGTTRRIEHLAGDADFVVVSTARRTGPATRFTGRTAIALVLTLAMLVAMTFKLLPTVVAVLLAAAAMVLLRCLSMEDAYRAISWESLVLIASMLPVATALRKTGGMDVVVRWITRTVGRFGPRAMGAGLFVLTSLFSQFISNTATAVLVSPIAVQTAKQMAVSPRPLLMTVAFAASTAFATPIASPVNTLVLTPGGYRFTDYARAGVPLQLLLLAAALLLIPLLFPF